ncbi:MAG: sulfite exporter TauE/SafE family protein [Chloroflexi bacterium]|nr:sulfite exporter TauE/SafE family protein [Chloroflexota bacterium]
MNLDPANFSLLTPLLAIGFGLLSFVSPCCLPLLPGYLGLIAGKAGESAETGVADRRALWWHGAAFVAGLSTMFALLGASASLLGGLLMENRPWLMQLGGVMIVVFGLQMLGVLRLGWLAREYLRVDPHQFAGRGGPAGAFLVGATFAIGWTPCIGLFLGSLLTIAAQQETAGQGALLLVLYGLGLGLPFLLAGVAADRALRWARWLRPHFGTVERTGGAILVGMGVLVFTGQLTQITAWAIRTFGLGLTF